jgi:hypothetical protein
MAKFHKKINSVSDLRTLRKMNPPGRKGVALLDKIISNTTKIRGAGAREIWVAKSTRAATVCKSSRARLHYLQFNKSARATTV